MRALCKAGTGLAVVALLLSSCAPERGFVLSVKNNSGALLRNVTVRWDSEAVEFGWLSSGSEKLQYDNPLPVPSSVTVAWSNEGAAHEFVTEVAVERGDRRRVFLYFTILPDGKVQGRSSYELSVGNSNRP